MLSIPYVVFSIFFFLGMSFWSCVSTPVPTLKDANLLKKEGNLTTNDQNKDGKPDSWVWHLSPDNPQVVKEEFDLNFDGKVDVQKIYAAGSLTEVLMDFDFDARFDQHEYYTDGALTKTETSFNPNGKIDTWKFFNQGQLERTEKDTNGDEKPDQWTYHEGTNVVKTGKDYNFDGLVDSWTP